MFSSQQWCAASLFGEAAIPQLAKHAVSDSPSVLSACIAQMVDIDYHSHPCIMCAVSQLGDLHQWCAAQSYSLQVLSMAGRA